MASSEMDLDGRMRAVLVQLALTSNGHVAKMDSNGGGQAGHVVLAGWLDPADAPHNRYFELYMRETEDVGRLRVLDMALDELSRIRFSRGHGGTIEAETLDDMFDQIIKVGEGWDARDVALALRTTPTIVRRARRARGREEEKGKIVEDSSGLGREERQRRVRELADTGRSKKEIAHYLSIPYITVRRDLEATTV